MRLLLGRGDDPPDGEVSWRCPIAGGQRTITIEPLPELDTPERLTVRSSREPVKPAAI